MDGIYVNKDQGGISVVAGDARLALLARRSDMEVMVQTLIKDAVVWIAPAEDKNTMEFFYVLSGSLILMPDSEPVEIKAGNSFYADGLGEEVLIRVTETARLLYITNRPMFDEVLGFQGDFDALMRRVDDKDNYTYFHSRNVMNYSMLLYRKLNITSITINDLATAALFHDIGKCMLPDEILKKPGRLTSTEFQQIVKHPLYSARLLQGRFGEKVAEIARSHHERLDGSGYPFGLSGDEISLEGRIIAVADSFDAMTTIRTYNNTAKGLEEAAEELCSMYRQYDPQVTTALMELVKSGEIYEVREVK